MTGSYKSFHPKIFAIIGPTASGKSEYAVRLAKKLNGEIISADSRQVYKGLNIGTGKVPGKWKRVGSRNSKVESKKTIQNQSGRNKDMTYFVYKNVPHHCIDYVHPKRQYSVAEFKWDAERAITDIFSRGKTPIICGGTGHWIDAVLFNQPLPEVPPDIQYRKKMDSKTAEQLFALLKKQDLVRANSIDPYNKRRLIRALEIIRHTGKPVPAYPKGIGSWYVVAKKGKILSSIPIQWVYINPPREKLYKNIERRLAQWFKDGLLREVKQLHKQGLSWKRMEDIGLEYRFVSRYLRNRIDYDTMYTNMLTETKHYAKRQQTWFNKTIRTIPQTDLTVVGARLARPSLNKAHTHAKR